MLYLGVLFFELVFVNGVRYVSILWIDQFNGKRFKEMTVFEIENDAKQPYVEG